MTWTNTTPVTLENLRGKAPITGIFRPIILSALVDCAATPPVFLLNMGFGSVRTYAGTDYFRLSFSNPLHVRVVMAHGNSLVNPPSCSINEIEQNHVQIRYVFAGNPGLGELNVTVIGSEVTQGG